MYTCINKEHMDSSMNFFDGIYSSLDEIYGSHKCLQTAEDGGLYTHIQPITDRVALNLEIISKTFQVSTKRTRILIGSVIYYLVLPVNPMGRILVR